MKYLKIFILSSLKRRLMEADIVSVLQCGNCNAYDFYCSVPTFRIFQTDFSASFCSLKMYIRQEFPLFFVQRCH